MKRPVKHRNACAWWSPPARGAWIETLADAAYQSNRSSPPARGAWVETPSLPLKTLAS